MSKFTNYVWIKEGDSIFKKVGKVAKSWYNDSMRDFWLAPNVIAGGVSTIPKTANFLYQLSPVWIAENQITKIKNTAQDPNYVHPWFFKRNRDFAKNVDAISERAWFRKDKASKTMYNLGNMAADIALGSVTWNAAVSVWSKIPAIANAAKYIRKPLLFWLWMFAAPDGSANAWDDSSEEKQTVPTQKVSNNELPKWTKTYVLKDWRKFFVNEQWFLSYY